MTDKIETVTLTPEEMEQAVTDMTAPAVHVMADIETWGTGNDALIVSIGACRFTKTDILDSFHVAIDPRTAPASKIDADTIMWWLSPERDEARLQWLEMEKIDLYSALMGFASWCTEIPSAALWGNGATFDNVILRSAFASVGQEYPFRFGQDQCYRTMKYRAPLVALERSGTHHNALDDAISQARHLQAIVKYLGCEL